MKKCFIFLIGLVNVNAFFNPLKQTINIYEARKRRVEDDYFDNFYDDYEEVPPAQTMKDLFIPKSERQQQYYNDICDHDIKIVIATGPAGTGKTLLPTQYAAKLLM